MLAHEIDFCRMYKVGPTAMALLTPDPEIIHMNDEFQAYVGCPLEEVVDRNIFEITPRCRKIPAVSQCGRRWKRP